MIGLWAVDVERIAANVPCIVIQTPGKSHIVQYEARSDSIR